jgi:hypothetical protein
MSVSCCRSQKTCRLVSITAHGSVAIAAVRKRIKIAPLELWRGSQVKRPFGKLSRLCRVDRLLIVRVASTSAYISPNTYGRFSASSRTVLIASCTNAIASATRNRTIATMGTSVQCVGGRPNDTTTCSAEVPTLVTSGRNTQDGVIQAGRMARISPQKKRPELIPAPVLRRRHRCQCRHGHNRLLWPQHTFISREGLQTPRSARHTWILSSSSRHRLRIAYLTAMASCRRVIMTLKGLRVLPRTLQSQDRPPVHRLPRYRSHRSILNFKC